MHRERIRQKIAEQKAKKLAAKRGSAATAAPLAKGPREGEGPALVYDPQAQKVEAMQQEDKVWLTRYMYLYCSCVIQLLLSNGMVG